MKNILEQDMKVSATLTDVNIQMGLIPSLTVVQDNMCEFFKNMGCDGLTMVPICNCFFVVTKTKICFNKFLEWLDTFKCRTEISNKSKVRLNLSTEFLDKNNEMVACALQEMCAMDADKRSLRLVDTTLVPTDLEVTKNSEIEFSRLNFEMTEEDLVKEHNIEVVNLDFYKHTNNVEYARLMLSTLELSFLVENIISDFEIHYINECRFGDHLKIYRKTIDDHIEFEIRKENNAIVKGLLNFRKIQK